MTGRRGSNLIEAFPTKEQREFAQGKIKKMSESTYFRYWTDFENSSSEKWKLLTDSEFGNSESGQGFWTFKTNVTPDDFAFVWDEARTRIFLRRMWDIYRYRKVN